MTTPELIVDGVYVVPMGSIVNTFLVVGDGVTLVDAGTRKGAGKIQAAMHSLGVNSLDAIALTHHHPDHRGAASVVRGAAPVYAHPADADVVRGDRPQPGPRLPGMKGVLLKIVKPIVETFIAGHPEAVPTQEIVDGDVVPGGLRAVHTPGHTAGHLCFLMEEKRLLFAGDAATYLKQQLGPPPAFYTEDMDLAKDTMKQVAELDFDVAVFGHGTVLRGKANTAFRKYVDSLASKT